MGYALGLGRGIISSGLHLSLRYVLLPAYLRSPEPVYAGKRLTQWLDAGAEPAGMAVHEIGPAATPWILKKLRWEHPRWGRWQTYEGYWRRVPAVARRALPKPRVAAYDEYRAATVLLEVGPQVVPQLTAALKENNPAVRITCAPSFWVRCHKEDSPSRGRWRLCAERCRMNIPRCAKGLRLL